MKFLKILFILLISLSAKSQNVYKTPSGAKYHLATCRMVNNVSQQMTLANAVEIGLYPCKICKPPINENLKISPQKKAKGESNTVQCMGTTKSGNRCKHMTSIANGYCFQHNPD